MLGNVRHSLKREVVAKEMGVVVDIAGSMVNSLYSND